MAGSRDDDRRSVLVVTTTLALPPEECRRLEGLLSVDERLRADRLTAVVRERFVVGRARLRLLLGRLLQVSPADLEFCYGRWGKPDLAGPVARPLHFNLSHSGNRGLIAVCRELPVGIDLEIRAANFTPEWSSRMAASILTDVELTAWRTLPRDDRPRALLETWVVKEAVFKALGCGLAGGLQRLSVPCDPGRLPETVTKPRPIRVSLTRDGDQPATTLAARLLDVGGDAHAAIATIGDPAGVTITSFEAFMVDGIDVAPVP